MSPTFFGFTFAESAREVSLLAMMLSESVARLFVESGETVCPKAGISTDMNAASATRLLHSKAKRGG
jgi:hypothetical protein